MSVYPLSRCLTPVDTEDLSSETDARYVCHYGPVYHLRYYRKPQDIESDFSAMDTDQQWMSQSDESYMFK